jgi:maltose phosphorylase
LSFNPKIPNGWEAYSFKVNYRNKILKINVAPEKTSFTLEGNEPIEIFVNGKKVNVEPNNLVCV